MSSHRTLLFVSEEWIKIREMWALKVVLAPK